MAKEVEQLLKKYIVDDIYQMKLRRKYSHNQELYFVKLYRSWTQERNHATMTMVIKMSIQLKIMGYIYMTIVVCIRISLFEVLPAAENILPPSQLVAFQTHRLHPCNSSNWKFQCTPKRLNIP
jgi:hypothetical protein